MSITDKNKNIFHKPSLHVLGVTSRLTALGATNPSDATEDNGSLRACPRGPMQDAFSYRTTIIEPIWVIPYRAHKNASRINTDISNQLFQPLKRN